MDLRTSLFTCSALVSGDGFLERGIFIFSINLLVFYQECRSLIGYATHVLFCDR